MAATVTLEDIIALVRKFTGSPDSSQLGDAEITTEINNYYRNIMPLQIELPELKGTCTLTTADTEASLPLPDTTVKIYPPVRIGSGTSPTSYTIGGFYYEPVHFYAKHNGSETKGTPVDILLQGRTILFQPTASGIFKLVFSSIEKPTTLIAAGLILQDRLRDLIAISTSLAFLLRRRDAEGQTILVSILPLYVQTLKMLGIFADTERLLDAHSKSSQQQVIAAPAVP